MRELRRDEPFGHHPTRAELRRFDASLPVVRAPPHEARLTLEPRHRLEQCRLTRSGHFGLHDRITERPQNGHGLRDRERQIEPRDPTSVTRQRRAIGAEGGARGEPSKHGAQIVACDLPTQTERGSARPRPPPGRLAGTGVVLVEPRRDLREIVRLRTHAQLPQAHHALQ